MFRTTGRAALVATLSSAVFVLGLGADAGAKSNNVKIDINDQVAITKVELPGPAVFTACLRDLTDRRTAEREQQALERRLRQSERLQSLGQLAGGVAHDFNNLLMVISSYAELMLDRLEEDGLRRNAEQIQSSGGDGTYPIGKPHQRKIPRGCPDLQSVRLQTLDGG